jgi:indolepyruvate ferredoxin oxidoreductase
MAPLDAEVALTDKYRVSSGSALMNGMQALVRMVLEQADLDKDNGLKTGGYVSGYRGSPIGGFDQELFRVRKELDARNIVFNPGLNEDLAATAVAGTQTLHHHDKPEVDGVFAVWYGKGPGVDRSVDAINHASVAGSAPKGGMLFVAGDDPLGKSSTTAHQSDVAFMHMGMPVLFPASVHEIVPLGLHGFALSRYSGAAVALKIITDVADSAGTVALDKLRPDFTKLPPATSAIGLHNAPGLLPFVAQEIRKTEERMDAAFAYARANRLNFEVIAPKKKKLGIVAVGKAYTDVMTALRMLGLDKTAADKGLGVYRMMMTWPIEPIELRKFVEGYDEILVVEEKRAIVETDIAMALYNEKGKKPFLAGKFDADGKKLIPAVGELTPRIVADAIARTAPKHGVDCPPPPAAPKALGNTPPAVRAPWFCAGCPHNRSTKLPDGSIAGGGIGCHSMAVLHDPTTTTYFSQMGGEGLHWVGRAPFSSRKHTFQNLGDGTYTHSGLLAIRAAIAAKVNITYKILYNDAVAMTGGQPIEGNPLPAEIAAQVHSLGVKEIVVVSDQIDQTRRTGTWPTSRITFRDRKDMDQIQRDLREKEGTTVILYVQTCAAEKRRRRKRGLYPDPPKRVVINEAVCEGCGDCGLKSNCVAIKPKDTIFGLKRRIDQTACNKDYSCVEGFCPSFVTVEGTDADPLLAKRGILHQPPDIAALPAPKLADADDFGAVVTGIGGTGVVTIGAVLSMAARLENKHALTLDQTGLSQKNGAVSSHLQISTRPIDDRPARIGSGHGTLLLACDMVVAASDDTLLRISPEKAIAVANGVVEPLANFARDPNARPDGEVLASRIAAYLSEDRVKVADTTALATRLVGDGMGSNTMLVGLASQAGALPVSPDAIEMAIRLNGAAIDMNLAAFRWGRWLAHDPAMVENEAHRELAPKAEAATYDDLVAKFESYLTDYQDAAYAARFRATLAKVEAAEDKLERGRRDTSRVAAQALFKTMAIKDEYEVARLHTHAAFKAKLADEFAPGSKLKFHLAPPLLARKDPVTGEPRKMAFGEWILPVFRQLAKMKTLRGGKWDFFGKTEERKIERAFVGEVEKAADLVASRLSKDNEEECRELLGLALEVKGYGHIKQKNRDKIRPRWAELTAALSA